MSASTTLRLGEQPPGPRAAAAGIGLWVFMGVATKIGRAHV